MNNNNDEIKVQSLPLTYRVEWIDETGTKRYKFYDDLFTAEKAERWLIKSGALGVYLVVILEHFGDEPTDRERAEQFGIA